MSRFDPSVLLKTARRAWCRSAVTCASLGVLLMTACSEERAPTGADSAPGPSTAATLQAAPNPVPADSSATTITWDAGAGGTAQLYVSQNGGPEKLVAENRKGSKPINWIYTGTYEFRLYAGTERESKLATIVVTGGKPAPKTLEQQQ